ncbi:MAG TPA: hypothetical protein VHG93_23090, partial [Longimicrobium sp.]|nr:hypothetical protein [Longimicrobium sp.]
MSTQTTAATPDELFQTALFGPVALPWKTVFLEPDPLTDLAQRPARGATPVGELYHENSKLYPQHPALARPAVDGREARADFVRKRAAAAAGDDELPAGAPAHVRALLEDFGRRAPDDVWYALEARLACAGAL